MPTACSKCGGTMERGFTTAEGLIGGARLEEGQSRLIFIVPGTTTSANPIRAFTQGVREGASHRRYFVVGDRCSQCGYLELFAAESNGLEG